MARAKSLVIILCLTVLLGSFLTFPVSAVSEAALSGPSSVGPGETFTVFFRAGGNVLGGSGTFNYDSSLLTLVGYSSALPLSWEAEFSGNNFLFYDTRVSSPLDVETNVIAAEFKVNNLAFGTKVSVSAVNLVLSDGNSDVKCADALWSAVVSAPLSSDTSLKSLSVSGYTLSPNFDPATLYYSVSVPHNADLIQVLAETSDPNAEKNISVGSSSATVTVTAPNGKTAVYTISVNKEPISITPAKNSDSRLKSLSVEGHVLSPEFDPYILQYIVLIPNGEDSVSVLAEAKTDSASVNINYPESIKSGSYGNVTVDCTAENGEMLTYTITVRRADEGGGYLTDSSSASSSSSSGILNTDRSGEKISLKSAGKIIAAFVIVLVVATGIFFLISRLSEKRRRRQHEEHHHHPHEDTSAHYSDENNNDAAKKNNNSDTEN